MTEAQKATIKVSELGERLNDLQAAPERDSAAIEAASKEYRDAQKALREAVKAEADASSTATPTVDAETRERDRLMQEYRCARLLGHVVNETRPDGVEAEAAAAFGLPPDQSPLATWGPVSRQVRRHEERQRAKGEDRVISPGPASTTVTMTAPTTPALFDRSIAPFLMVDLPIVGPGQANYPVLSTSTTVGAREESAVAPETAAAYSVLTATPRRITGAFRFSWDDSALFPQIEMDLRRDVGMAVSDGFDNQALNGSNASGQLNGILRGSAAADTTLVTFERAVGKVASAVDGLFAADLMGVRQLVGPHTYRKLATVFRTMTDPLSVVEWLSRVSGGLRTTRRLPDPASDTQQALTVRTNPMGDRCAVAPVWDGVRFVRDEVTSAAKGEVVVTAVVMVGGVVILRGDCYKREAYHIA